MKRAVKEDPKKAIQAGSQPAADKEKKLPFEIRPLEIRRLEEVESWLFDCSSGRQARSTYLFATPCLREPVQPMTKQFLNRGLPSREVEEGRLLVFSP
ncbi:MAG TPA: hypothetical protein VMP11_18320 [Verrucomicrobiae bacterium]|nr:hypothetical protein [Verrucomicrobiae bacterium]